LRFLLFLFLLLFSIPSFAGPENPIEGWLNFSCVDFKIKGICIKHEHGKIKVGVKISYYLPVAVVEAPPVPYMTKMAPLKPVLKGAEPLVEDLVSSVPILSEIGAYEFGGNQESEEDTYYREVHIFSFPTIANPVLQLLPLLCGRLHLDFFFWLSETDPLQWRFGLKDYLKFVAGLPQKVAGLGSTVRSFSTAMFLSPGAFLDALKERIGAFKEKLSDIKAEEKDWKELMAAAQKEADKVASMIPDAGWGSKTPHTGYVHEVSSTIAYHLMAVRALDYVFPLKPRWGVDKFQMVYPTPTGCYVLGDDRIKTELGKMIGGETPVWIYWYKFECCVF